MTGFLKCKCNVPSRCGDGCFFGAGEGAMAWCVGRGARDDVGLYSSSSSFAFRTMLRSTGAPLRCFFVPNVIRDGLGHGVKDGDGACARWSPSLPWSTIGFGTNFGIGDGACPGHGDGDFTFSTGLVPGAEIGLGAGEGGLELVGGKNPLAMAPLGCGEHACGPCFWISALASLRANFASFSCSFNCFFVTSIEAVVIGKTRNTCTDVFCVSLCTSNKDFRHL